MFELRMNTDNAAFEGQECAGEIARILRDLAARIEHEGFSCSDYLRDINGNLVGHAAWDVVRAGKDA